MKKVMKIEGMTCNHCKMRVEKALMSLEGVTLAVVDLEGKSASVEGEELVDELLAEAVDDAGYDVIGIE